MHMACAVCDCGLCENKKVLEVMSRRGAGVTVIHRLGFTLSGGNAWERGAVPRVACQ